MEEGQSITSYIDDLEKDMFEEYGIEPPTEEELNEFADSDDYLIQEEKEALRQSSIDDENSLHEEFLEEEDEEEDMPSYRKMDNVLPNEGKIDEIKILPFHSSQAHDMEQ